MQGRGVIRGLLCGSVGQGAIQRREWRFSIGFEGRGKGKGREKKGSAGGRDEK